MFKGNRNTENRESEVNARAGVKCPPSKVNNPKEVTVTTTGMLFSIKLLNCKETISKSEITMKLRLRYSYGYAHVFAGFKSPYFWFYIYIMGHEFSHDRSIMNKIDAKNLDQHVCEASGRIRL